MKQLKILKCLIVKTANLMIEGKTKLNFYGFIIPTQNKKFKGGKSKLKSAKSKLKSTKSK